MQIHIIMPVGADPNYTQKKQVIETSASLLGITVHFPDYCQIKPEFDLKSSLQDLESSNFVLVDYSTPHCQDQNGSKIR